MRSLVIGSQPFQPMGGVAASSGHGGAIIVEGTNWFAGSHTVSLTSNVSSTHGACDAEMRQKAVVANDGRLRVYFEPTQCVTAAQRCDPDGDGYFAWSGVSVGLPFARTATAVCRKQVP